VVTVDWGWGLVSVGNVNLRGEEEQEKPGGGCGLAPSHMRTTTMVAA
jgi:hypothetical protein